MENTGREFVKQESKPHITYKYAWFAILIQTVMLSPLYILSIWEAITSETFTPMLIFVLSCAVFIGVMNLRSLLRLTETIFVTEDRICKLSWLGQTHILWSEVAQVKNYKSWLERDCYKVDSVNGEQITVSEMLDSYVELYKILNNKISSNKFVK